MPSPFPGMDPYLEQHSGDIHSRVVMYASDSLRSLLPAELYARVEERVYIESPWHGWATSVPDVRVVEHPTRIRETPPTQSSDLIVAEPIVVHLPEEEMHETYVEIRDSKNDHRVVTVIEVLSPANKRNGEGRDTYLEKQRALRSAGVSLLEIDLLRGGVPPLPIAQEILPLTHRSGYRICAHPAWDRQNVRIYAAGLEKELPNVNVPLRGPDETVVLNLQDVIEQAYENGDYAMTIDYTADPVPPLDSGDAKWADELLKRKGLR